MFERFTERARRTVERSTELAVGQHATHVRPEHLFLAQLDEPDNLALWVLEDLGAPADRLREGRERRRGRYVDGLGDEDAEALATIGINMHEVLRHVRHASVEARMWGRPRFARELKKALELSLREALELRHSYIGTEHLLLGLVRGGDPAVCDTLAALEISPADLRAAVADAVRKAS